VQQLVRALPAQGVDCFVALRQGSSHCQHDRCVPEAARAQLLAELRHTPLFQLVREALRRAGGGGEGGGGAGAEEGEEEGEQEQEEQQQQPGGGQQQGQRQGAQHAAQPPPGQQQGLQQGLPGRGASYRAEKATMLLLLLRQEEWGVRWAAPEQQRRWRQLLDVAGVSIVEAEAQYLRGQLANLDGAAGGEGGGGDEAA
jgi:hypothetical protein